ncbi:MAG TPA: tripartite tricarboxylate transporter substrate binding protein [Burkholderiales bacterium]|nr:tripartite tricarboxylate transporter substrate binding protein [Burkholderiales bacterium]
MIRHITSYALYLGTGLAAGAAVLPAQAQTWPAKPIRVVVPYPSGGTSDILARMVGQKLTEAWSQQIIVDSRPGANGNIGTEITVRAPPDGYTFLLTDVGNLMISPSTFAKLPFDPVRDLAPVGMVSYSPHLLTVHPSVPVKNVQELIALAKKNPGKLNYPTALGGAPHLAGLAMQNRSGVNWVYIPTKGGSQSLMTVATGEGDLLFLGMLQTLPHVKNGRVKVIAISSEKRDPALPDTPTVAETRGFEGFFTGSWQGILGPAKLPADIVNKFNGELRRVLALQDVKDKLGTQGTVPLIMTPQETGKFLLAEKDRWAKVVKDSGFEME